MKTPEWLQQARQHWQYTGKQRPDFAVTPGPGQESVWDYPRPPRLEPLRRHVQVKAGDMLVASSEHGLRALETASPPTVYIPFADIDWSLLQPCDGRSLCEWKGEARYWQLSLPQFTAGPVGWDYPQPFAHYEALQDHLAFYPGRIACFVGNERVRPQPGSFYGGWITTELVGPFKGEPGSEGW